MSTRRFGKLASLGFMLLSILTAPGAKAQTGPPPFVNSANNSANYQTIIAQGSLFVVFGYNLGPADLVQVSQFPLVNNLAGTSVTVTSGSTTLPCPMIYTSAGQVAAILPSNTPTGKASITVAYNGQTASGGFSTAQVTVARASFGIYTTTSTGLGSGIFTNAISGALKTLTNSAQPGELVFVWGTGIGPISTADNVLPTSFPSFPNVQVWVGGQSAQIYYAGRSGCCSGVDEIAFYVPPVAGGCNVPVTVAVAGNSSTTVTMPVNASGGACNDAGPTLPTSILTKAAAGQPVRLAAISVGPSAILGAGSEPRVVADHLSAALHTKVSEADASKLMRAYRTHSVRGIRLAMAKYASRWKALDQRTKDQLIARISFTQDTALAEFGSFSSENVAATVTNAQFPAAGECTTLPNNFPFGLGSIGGGLDAGASLALTGAAGSYSLKPSSKGQYQASLGASATGQEIPLGAYTISGTGGKDVGAFSTSVTVASHLAISNKSSLTPVDLTQPLTVTWTGGVAGSYVLIGGGSTHAPHSYFVCAEDAGKGTFTIPSNIISSVNATSVANGILWISPNPLSNPITIPGVDAAYFIDGSSDSVKVAFGKSNGANVTNVLGSIDGLYPASGAAAAANGGMSTLGPVASSALLTAGAFTVAFDISPGANPFTVLAMCAAGSAIININPAQNTWQVTYIVPTAAARAGDFSGDGFLVTNFKANLPFPNNEVPFSLIDPIAIAAAGVLELPNVTSTTAPSPNGTWSASGTLPAGGHFTIGPGTSPPQNFGGFINLTNRGAQSSTFALYVDGQLVASRQVPFTTY